MIALSALLLHLQCSGTYFVSTETFSTGPEIWINDLPLTSEKNLSYRFGYGRGGFQASVTEAVTFSNDHFFVRQTPNQFVTEGTDPSGVLVRLTSSVDYPTFSNLAADGLAILELTQSSLEGYQYLHCRSIP